jgi:hypothetical protein
MENAQKAIMIGVGLFITIIVIAAVMLITGLGQDMLTKGTDQTNAISSSLQDQITSDYDGAEITGSQVVAAIKRFYTTERLGLAVANGTVFTNYGTFAIANAAATTSIEYSGTLVKSGVGAMSSSSANTYIVPSSKYSSKVLRGTGNTVVGIVFTRIS